MTLLEVITTNGGAEGPSLILQGLFVILFAGILYYFREKNQGKSKKLQQHLLDQESAHGSLK